MNVIGKFELTSSIQDFAGAPSLAVARDVVSYEIRGETYVYVAGQSDASVQILTMDGNGDLTPVSSTPRDLSSPATLEIMEVGNKALLVVGTASSQLRIFEIDQGNGASRGSLTQLTNFRNVPLAGESNEGEGVLGNVVHVEEIQVGNNSYLGVIGQSTNTVSLFEVRSNGNISQVSSVNDSDDVALLMSRPEGLTSAQIGNKTFLYVNGITDQGVSVFEVRPNGNLNFVEAISGIGSPNAMTVGTFDGDHYLFVANHSAQNIAAYEIGNNGTLTEAFATERGLIDNKFLTITDLEILNVDGVPFLLASSSNNDAVVILSVDGNEGIEVIESLSDATNLDAVSSVSTVQTGGKVFLLATAPNKSRITAIEIGGDDDAVVGTDGNDQLVGQRGDDDLIGLKGADLLIAGAGDDLLSGRRGNDDLQGDAGDDILIGGAGDDLLDGGAGSDLMIGGAGLDTVSYASSSGAVNVDLNSQVAFGGTSQGDQLFGIENVTGSSRNDTLTGDGGRNALDGGKGNDVLLGGGERDTIDGGAGKDTIEGGAGNDRMSGGSGNDRMDAAAGNDRLNGDSGNDLLIGGSGNDTLNGGSGQDRLQGDQGTDQLSGGGGSDTFILNENFGNDTITDFNPANEVVRFVGIDGADEFSDLTIFDIGGTATVLFDNGDTTLVFEGVSRSDLSADNFDFA